LEEFADQLTDARRIASDMCSSLDSASYKGLRTVVFCGMGGSAIAGDVVRNVLHERLPLPLAVCRDYTLPAYCDHTTLLIASSYSGHTEETLAAVRQGLSLQARIVALTTGGELSQIGKESSFPVVVLPGGLQPRQSIGYSAVTVYALLSHLLLGGFSPEDVQEAETYVRLQAQSYHLPASGPTHLAARAAQLSSRPFIVHASEANSAAALRLKGQLSENAKVLAFASTIPEMNHNEIVGWEMIKKGPSLFSVVLIRDRDDHPQVQKRFEFVKGMLAGHTVTEEFWAEGNGRFARLLSALYYADWLSFYVALARGEDPTPVDAITALKRHLSRS
jgi:glucose/mannose-6-phosphate isomerase